MKSKIKILLLTLTCFTLIGCPTARFHSYQFIGTELSVTDSSFSRIEFNEETDLHIKTGYYRQLTNNEENGIVTFIKVNSNFDFNKDSIIKEVKSSRFGLLKKNDSLLNNTNTLIYNLTFEKLNERKALKIIENDTISIQLVNGKKLQFVRKTAK